MTEEAYNNEDTYDNDNDKGFAYVVPEDRKAECFIPNDTYADSFTNVLREPDLYSGCGVDLNCIVVGLPADEEQYLSALCPPPHAMFAGGCSCYNYRTEEYEDAFYARQLAHTYYEEFEVYANDPVARKVFIAPRMPRRSTSSVDKWQSYKIRRVLTKCLGAEQERENQYDYAEVPKNIIPVCHKKLDRVGYWVSVDQNYEFLYEENGFIEDAEKH